MNPTVTKIQSWPITNTGEHYLALTLQYANNTATALCSIFPQQDRSWPIFGLPAQHGCNVGCSFCSVPRLEAHMTPQELHYQIELIKTIAQDYPTIITQWIPKFSFVKWGELLSNPYCQEILTWLADQYQGHIKISSVMPATARTRACVKQLLDFTWSYHAPEHRICFQVSWISTDQSIRKQLTRTGGLMDYAEIKEYASEYVCKTWRKVSLTFTVYEGALVFPNYLLDPNLFAIRLYRFKNNSTNFTGVNQETIQELEALRKKQGYDIIVYGDPLDRDLGRLT